MNQTQAPFQPQIKISRTGPSEITIQIQLGRATLTKRTFSPNPRQLLSRLRRAAKREPWAVVEFATKTKAQTKALLPC